MINECNAWVGLDCRIKANCPLVGHGPVGGVPSVGIFLRDSRPYICEFRRKPGKLRTTRSTSATEIEPGTSLLDLRAELLRNWWDCNA